MRRNSQKDPAGVLDFLAKFMTKNDGCPCFDEFHDLSLSNGVVQKSRRD